MLSPFGYRPAALEGSATSGVNRVGSSPNSAISIFVTPSGIVISVTGARKTGDKGTRNTRKIEGDLLGICYRVYVPTPQGNMAMMEFSEPKSLISRTEWPGE